MPTSSSPGSPASQSRGNACSAGSRKGSAREPAGIALHRAIEDGQFLDQEFDKLTEPEVEAFKKLAELEDWDFLGLIVGGKELSDPHEAAVLAKLRKC